MGDSMSNTQSHMLIRRSRRRNSRSGETEVNGVGDAKRQD